MNALEIGKRIRQERLKAELTLEALGVQSKVDPATLSRMENGTLGKKENLEKVQAALNVDLGIGEEDQTLISIGYPAILWSSPIISLALSDDMPDDIKMTCIYKGKEPKDPLWNPSRSDFASLNNNLYTAKELIPELKKNKFTAVFLPKSTVQGDHSLCKVAYITDTAKNGVYILAIWKDKEGKRHVDDLVKSDNRQGLLNHFQEKAREEKLVILHPKGTATDEIYDRYFTKEKIWHEFDTERKFIPVNNISSLVDDIKENLKLIFSSPESKEIVLFMGWDFNVFNIQKMLTGEDYGVETIDCWTLTDENEPFLRITLDAIVLKDSLENPKFIKELHDFLEILGKKINMLADEKMKTRNPYILPIAEFLGLQIGDESDKTRYDKALGYIKKTNFSLMFYPEFVDILISKQAK